MSADSVAAAPSAATTSRAAAVQMIYRVAWMSVILGLFVQLLVVIALVFVGERLGSVEKLINDTARSVTWPFIVCVGIAFGKAAAKLRAPAATARFMGIGGLLAAPVAFTAARMVHKSLGQALSLDAAGVATWAVISLTILKTAQYGFLGNALGRIEDKPWGGWKAHAAVGFAAGVVFGIGALIIQATHKTPTTSEWITNSINEIIVPVGCALIVFASGRMGKVLAE